MVRDWISLLYMHKCLHRAKGGAWDGGSRIRLVSLLACMDLDHLRNTFNPVGEIEISPLVRCLSD